MRGSVRKRGSTYTWYLNVQDPVAGKRRQRSKGGFRTKKECQAALNEALAALRTATFVDPSPRTLGSFLVEEWLPAVRPPRLRLSTWSSYQMHAKRHIVPALGMVALQRLGPAQLTTFYRTLLESGRRDKRGGLAPKTVRNIHGTVHAALQDAVRWSYVARNVASAVELPKGMAPEMRVWSPEELRAFLDQVRSDRLFAAWLLIVTTGMRRGELAGLRWIDLDLDAGRVSPRRPRVVVNHQVVVSEPKTAKGRRSLALDPATVTALRRHRTQQAQERLAAGPLWQDSGLVFAWPDGSPIHPQRFSSWLEQHAPGGWTSENPAARRAPQLRDRGTGRGHSGKGRQRAPRARQHRDHDGHLQPRPARPGRAGRRHRGAAHPRGIRRPPEALR
jgi:integrase